MYIISFDVTQSWCFYIICKKDEDTTYLLEQGRFKRPNIIPANKDFYIAKRHILECWRVIREYTINQDIALEVISGKRKDGTI